MIQPRPYQTEAVKAIIDEWRAGVTRSLASLPTGCGKTIIFGLLAKELDMPTLILAHREELLAQAVAKIDMVMPGADIGVLRAEDTTGLMTKICVASVQTAMQDRRLEALKEREFGLCVIDEAHHATAESYMKIVNALGFMDGCPDKLLVGVTATAYRGDNVALGEVFQKVVYERSIMTMIRAGYLCDAEGISVSTDADLSGVHTRAGDFALNELSDVLDTPARNRLIAESYLQHANGRRGVVFCCDVQHAINVAEAFSQARVHSAAVYGDMDHGARRRILAAYEVGALSVLTNCNVLTEGWDAPETSAIMLARPTKSPVLYTQMVGRGLRPAPGKESCLVIDYADTCGRHNLCGLATLAGDPRIKPKKRERLLDAVERIECELREIDRKARLTPRVESFELFERSKYVWVNVGQHYRLNGLDDSTIWAKCVADGYLPFVMSANGAIETLSDGPLSLGYATGVCEDYMRQYGRNILAAKDASWRKGLATDAQLDTLRRLGVQWEGEITKGEASQMIDTALSIPATANQRHYISLYGLHPQPELLTKREAGRLIGEHKKQQASMPAVNF